VTLCKSSGLSFDPKNNQGPLAFDEGFCQTLGVEKNLESGLTGQ
jgi:hypothetical protein